jgi:hypothetical protein
MIVKTLVSRKRTLYVPGELTFDPLFAPENLNRIQQLFSLSEIGFGERTTSKQAVIGKSGQCKLGDELHAIVEIAIEAMAVEVTVEGHTVAADTLSDLLIELIRIMPSTKIEGRPRVRQVSYETFSICELNFDARAMYSDEWLQFVAETRPLIESTYPGADIQVLPTAFQHAVHFKLRDPNTAHLIVPKTFTFELRQTATPQERAFWTASPLRSEQHLAIVEKLERVMAGRSESLFPL